MIVPPRPGRFVNTKSPDEVVAADDDAIYFTGGHAVMFASPDGEVHQRITREIYERGRIDSSVCQGLSRPAQHHTVRRHVPRHRPEDDRVRLQEEILAGVDKLVPYNAVQRAKERGALYEKAALPFVAYTVFDGNLVTGQNPGSTKEAARKIAAFL